MPETQNGATAAAEKPNVPKASSLSQTEKSAVALGPEGVRGTVASPQGPLPIGAVARDEEHAQELLEEQEKRVKGEERRSVFDRKLTREQMEEMPAGDLRAAAATLGYKDYPLAGKRGLMDFVEKAQAGDERFKGKK